MPKRPKGDRTSASLTASRPATPESDKSDKTLASQPGQRPAKAVGAAAGSQKSRANDAGAASQGDKGKGGQLRSPARRPGRPKPNPRPLPPRGPEDDDEEILNPFAGRKLPRSPASAIPEVVEPEPELPPTPEHPDPVVSTPPSGIHNTPSKRPRRSKALAERIKGSSPLKQPALVPPEKPQEKPKEKPQEKPPVKPQGRESRSKPRSKSSKRGGASHPPKSQTSKPQTLDEQRGIKPFDPDAEKKKLRDSLLAEVAKLERDLDVATEENERIRQARLGRREPSTPANGDDIVRVLQDHVLPPEKEAEPEHFPSPAWLAAALDPLQFLPFNKQDANNMPRPTIFPRPGSAEPAEEPETSPVSHHPVPMTAEEALPYLQVFTSLAFTSHISPLPREARSDGGSAGGALLQRHSISATSTLPPGLFAARIEMTVNTKTSAVTELAVPRLDPAAAAELGPFIERIVAAPTRASSSALTNNVSVLAWAMGEWLRVAAQRAKVWSVLERELADKRALADMVARSRVRKKQRRRTRRQANARSGGDNGDDDQREDDADEDGQDAEGGKKKGAAAVTVKDLLPFMGRTSIDFDIPVLDAADVDADAGAGAGAGVGSVSALRVQWRIDFDWTGEARSDIGVLVSLPAKWYKHDERGELSRIPALFDELIRGGEDPLAAVRTVVSLLAGEQRAA